MSYRLEVAGIRYQVSGIKYQVSGVRVEQASVTGFSAQAIDLVEH